MPTYLQLVHQVEHALQLGYLREANLWGLCAHATGLLVAPVLTR
jgi:hypothetical protein